MSVDLTSTYLGLTLRNPVIASPGPVTGDPDQWRRLDDAGVGAIVLPSLFEEEIESESWWVSDLLDEGRDTVAEASDYLPEFEDYSIGPDRFLDLVTRAKATVDVPVIASLNGTTSGGWVKYAARLVDAGADAIELNVYDVITDPRVTGARGRGSGPGPRQVGARRGRGPRGGQGRSVVQRPGQHGHEAGRRRAPTASCCSTGSTSRTSTSRSRRCARG